MVVANSAISLDNMSRNSSLVEFVSSEADDREFLGQQIVLGEVVERGKQFALGEIAGSAEDHHGAGVARAAVLIGVEWHSISRPLSSVQSRRFGRGMALLH